MVTVADGCEFNTIVNIAVPPAASVVTNPLLGETVTPATSLSVFESETFEASFPLYSASLLMAAAVIMLYEMLPSTIGSSCPATVTV